MENKPQNTIDTDKTKKLEEDNEQLFQKARILQNTVWKLMEEIEELKKKQK